MQGVKSTKYSEIGGRVFFVFRYFDSGTALLPKSAPVSAEGRYLKKAILNQVIHLSKPSADFLPRRDPKDKLESFVFLIPLFCSLLFQPQTCTALL